MRMDEIPLSWIVTVLFGSLILLFVLEIYSEVDKKTESDKKIEYNIECYSNGNMFMSDVGSQLVREGNTYTYVSVKTNKKIIIPQKNCILSCENDYK
ncbi:hypothetical protein SAMN05660772_02046 [Pasteurella testudinis DSM 23072]|uniref:Uncharacterized protein n=1 Tax=Pasteurella testudinis DSM 23072 TaxID=1122938 RepID=A0A1W1UME3_9PAST|nr:hypothetical protein [Pasteurella testudinis]SMB82308.1 hypothetical protein SAMN05660772_02046 [Pasteurella testudinis DSM 23072]SUB51484.1 Uncharacterised protein [Pasteurella testudinis]